MEVYERTAELLEASVGDELVALEPLLGRCFGFNSLATRVWDLLKSPKSMGELIANLQTGYDGDEIECSVQVEELLRQMSDLRLVDRRVWAQSPSESGRTGSSATRYWKLIVDLG